MSKHTVVGDNSPTGIIKHWENKTKRDCAHEILRCYQEIERLKDVQNDVCVSLDICLSNSDWVDTRIEIKQAIQKLDGEGNG